MRLRRVGPALFFAAGVWLAAGCGGGQPATETLSDESRHIMRAAQVFHAYKAKHKGAAPASLDELKKWAKTMKPDELTQIGISDVDDAFVSPRDKQPYQMVKPGNDMKSKMGGQEVLLYEKEGKDGKHLTVSAMGTAAREMDRERLKSIVPDM